MTKAPLSSDETIGAGIKPLKTQANPQMTILRSTRATLADGLG